MNKKDILLEDAIVIIVNDVEELQMIVKAMEYFEPIANLMYDDTMRSDYALLKHDVEVVYEQSVSNPNSHTLNETIKLVKEVIKEAIKPPKEE